MPQGREFAAGPARAGANAAAGILRAKSPPAPARALAGALKVLLPSALGCALLSSYSPKAWADETLPPVPAQYRLAMPPTGSALAPAWGEAPLHSGQEFVFHLPASFRFDSLAGINLEDLGSPLERPRATYRYTWFSRPGWDLKVGLSTSLDAGTPWQRFVSSSPMDHLRVGSLPTMHFASEGRLTDRWLLSVSAEGLRTARGQGLDMDLRVDYSLTRDVALFGSYRLTDSSGEGAEVYGFVPSNSAQFGVRLRF